MQGLLTGKKRLPGFEIKSGFYQTEIGVLPCDWGANPHLTQLRPLQAVRGCLWVILSPTRRRHIPTSGLQTCDLEPYHLLI